MRKTRKEHIEEVIKRGNIDELLGFIEYCCGCVGNVDGELFCSCEMTSRQIREAVSYAALKRGTLLRLSKGE